MFQNRKVINKIMFILAIVMVVGMVIMTVGAAFLQ